MTVPYGLNYGRFFLGSHRAGAQTTGDRLLPSDSERQEKTPRSDRPFSLADAFVTLYDQLRAVARARLAGNPLAGTLQATAVVNEALVRLLRSPPSRIDDEQHLLALASQAIRNVIVDHVRRKKARGGRPSDDESEVDRALATAIDRVTDPSRTELLLDLDAALDVLSADDPELRTVVELYCYAGMTHAEIAAMLYTSERTIRRRWRFAAAELRKRLSDWSESHGDRIGE